MGAGEQQPRRGFINRYWVLIVIILWLIAWSARDWLAPAESEPAADANGEVIAEERAESEAEREVAKQEEAERKEAEREEAEREEAKREEAEREEAEREEAEREEAEREEAEREEAEREEADPATLLAEARAAFRAEGREAAQEILSEGLDQLPEDSRARVDVLGELGNLEYAGGDVATAMETWDQALEKLPASERPAWIEPLRPIYGRHHPDGAAHLDRFRPNR